MSEWLSLKWGTLKGWKLKTDRSREIAQKYFDLGCSMSAMAQHDTDEQKTLICELIDALDAETVHLDWDGIDVSKDEAKRYVMEYGRPS